MSHERFLESFGRVANAPGGIIWLKELIISLAIDGSLSESLPDDLPVDIEGFKTPAKKRQKKWREGLVEDCLLFEYGKNLPRKKRSNTGEYNVYGSNGIVGTHDAFLTTEPSIIVGRKGSSGALNISTGPSWTTDVAYYVVPPKSIDFSYCYYLLVSLNLDKLGKGIKPGLSRKEAYALSVKIPPLAEQKRIVEKVDALMALCDRLEEQQQERAKLRPKLAKAANIRFAENPTPENLQACFAESGQANPQELRKTILSLAVQGSLVKQQKEEENAQSLIQRVFLSNGIKKKKDQKSMSGNLPVGWGSAELGTLLEKGRRISYGVIKLGPEPLDGGISILRCSDVKYRYIEQKNVRTITSELSGEYARTILQGGELVVNVRGTLGGCAVVPVELAGYNIAREVAVVPIHREVSAEYVLNVISSSYFQSFINTNLRGIAYKGLNLGILRKFVIPVPPIQEQRRIVAKVEELMALVDKLEEQQIQRDELATGYAQSALSALTGTDFKKQPEKMKAPKTELISKIRLSIDPEDKQVAPLASLLAANDSELEAKVLWQRSGLAIEDFYQQLKKEISAGYIQQPEAAKLKVLS